MSWICGAVGSPDDPKVRAFPGRSTGRMAAYGAPGPFEAERSFTGSFDSDGVRAGSIELVIAGRVELGGETQSAGTIVDRFRSHGEDFLDRLRGAFALALFDGTTRRLHLLRDPIGDHPLFFTAGNGVRAFASLPSGLFPITGGRPDLDGLAAQRDGSLTGNRTPFEAVSRVLPGEHVVLGEEGFTRSFPWLPPADAASIAVDPSVVDEVRGLLDQAVRNTLPDDGLVACHLSSGRDSGAVTATAARLAPGRVIAFTGAPAAGAALGRQKAREGDESAAAGRLAAALGVEQYTIRDDQSLFAPLTGTARVFQTMMHPLSNLGWMAAINRAAQARGARTLLVGSMGNITLNAGGLPALQDYLRSGRLLRWASELRSAAARPDVSWKGAIAASVKPWLPTAISNAIFQRFGDYAFPGPDRFVRAAYRIGRREPAELYDGRKDWRADFARGYLLSDPGLRRLGVLGRYGLAERDPLADRALAERLLALPASAFLEAGRYRPLADAVLSDRLPSFTLTAGTRGLQSADWLGRFDAVEALGMIEEWRTSGAVTAFLDLGALAGEIETVKGLRNQGFGRQIGRGWHLMEAIQIASFLFQLDRHADDFGVF